MTEFKTKSVTNINIGGNVAKGEFELLKCHQCANNVKSYINKINWQNKKRAMKILKDVKEEKENPMKQQQLEQDLKLLQKEIDEVREYNEELMRQIQILIPMVHKDARKMYYEMHPHMDRFRDENAGRTFFVVNLGTQENLGKFTNVGMVAEELEIKSSKIEACLKGRINQVNGFTFYYDNETR